MVILCKPVSVRVEQGSESDGNVAKMKRDSLPAIQVTMVTTACRTPTPQPSSHLQHRHGLPEVTFIPVLRTHVSFSVPSHLFFHTSHSGIVCTIPFFYFYYYQHRLYFLLTVLSGNRKIISYYKEIKSKDR